MKAMLELRDDGCSPMALLVVNVSLAFANCAIAVIAFCQLIRIHFRSSQLGWTRQKVGPGCAFSSPGASVPLEKVRASVRSPYLSHREVLRVCLAVPQFKWQCWSQSCGFISMACPKILFLAAFLLLLSFWIDLFHQADDEDEDEDEECGAREALLEKTLNRPNLLNTDRHRKCFPLRCFHVASRQRFVIFVVLFVFFLMMASAVLMWIGTGKNPINITVIARVYIDFFAIAVLLSGGALACYGVLLFIRMKRVRSDWASSETWKVAGLAVVSVICFTSSAFVALFTDIPLLYHWNRQQMNAAFTSALLILYYFIGSSVPSVFLLWVMRELPPSISARKDEGRTVTFMNDWSVAALPSRHWTTAMSAQSQISRASPI